MIRRLGISALVAFLTVSKISAQDFDPLDEILEYFEDKAITVHIVIRLLDNRKVLVWDAEYTEATVAGRALKVRLVGEDVVIEAYVLPFGSIESDLKIVAYGQLWFSEGPDEGIQYESFMKSLPVEPGERVILLPLGGYAVDSETETYYTIQLEIQLFPYSDSEDSRDGESTL